LERLSEAVTRWSGTSTAFVSALALIVLWLVTGPLFHFSDTWQLVINTTTTVVTFLMVFLIQRAQTKSVNATFIKLNELIASIDGASNRLIEAEDLPEVELEVLRRHFRQLVEMAQKDGSLTRSHSVEEATERHRAKSSRRRPIPGGRAQPVGRRRRNGAG
jgi:low affinity Fe/Cu permease